MSRFSALFSSAAFVKLNDPVITASPWITMTLLCAIARASSIFVGIPALKRKVADEYSCVLWLLSSMASYFNSSLMNIQQGFSNGSLC